MEIVEKYIQLHFPETTNSKLSRLLLGDLKENSIDVRSYSGLCTSMRKPYTAFPPLDISADLVSPETQACEV